MYKIDRGIDGRGRVLQGWLFLDKTRFSTLNKVISRNLSTKLNIWQNAKIELNCI